MKKNVIQALMVSLFTVALTASPGRSEDLKWSHDLQDSIKQAKSQNKFVLADVYTDWCGWCKRLDATTFSDAKMVSYLNSKFICVKLNAEDHGQGEKAAKENRVDGYPCGLVYNGEGSVVGRISGYEDADGYTKSLSDIVSK